MTDALPDGWAEVRLLKRLWAAVPQSDRATAEDVRRRYAGRVTPKQLQDGTQGTDQDYQAVSFREAIARVESEPACEIAVQDISLAGKKWLPCASEVFGDLPRCSKHGGPSRSRNRETEIQQLRRRVAELEAQLDP